MPLVMWCDSSKQTSSYSSSTKLDANLKKSKTFVSPNRFSSLSADEDLPGVFSPYPVVVSPAARPKSIASNHLGDEENELVNKITPPIFISNVTNYFVQKTDLISLVDTDGLTATAKGIFLTIKSHSCVEYVKIVD